LCGPCFHLLSTACLYSGKLDEAEAAIRRYQLIAKGGYPSLGKILLLKGEAETALAAFDEQREPKSNWLSGRALALHDLGRQEEFESVVAELEENWGDQIPADLASIHSWVGDADTAFYWLDKAFGDDIDMFFYYMWNPEYSILHDDPRWLELRERAGLSADRLEALEFEIPESLKSKAQAET
jgi:tetratricopeptide (TPR) repeat protein